MPEKKKKDLELGEKLIYWGYCISTLGLVWVMKIVIKKAIIEARD